MSIDVLNLVGLKKASEQRHTRIAVEIDSQEAF